MLPSRSFFRSKPASGPRASPRQQQHGLTCNLGEITDLSSAGCRLRCRWSLTGRVDLVLTDYTRAGQLTADVVWSRPVGNFQYEVGLKFRKLTREMSGRLSTIAMGHRFRRAI